MVAIVKHKTASGQKVKQYADNRRQQWRNGIMKTQEQKQGKDRIAKHSIDRPDKQESNKLFIWQNQSFQLNW